MHLIWIFPTSNARYTLTLTTPTDQTWNMTAVPKNAQAGDGSIILNSLGQKCWAKGVTTCTLSSTSAWDGR